MASGLEEIVRFGTADYVVFVGLIATSLGIGVFHAFTGNRNPEDYLFGGRSMSVLPVSVSLLSSYISAIAVLGCPGETYGHGLQISMLSAGTVIGVLLATVIFLPVFYPLKMTSINEYLELRFRSRFLRLTIFLVQLVPTFVYSGLCLYAPTLAMASVTPLSVEANIIILGVVCFVYSAMGGLRAVVWTDVVQMAVILAGTVSVVVVACVRVGGLEEVWKIAETADRTQLFDLSLNPYKRHTMANVMTMGAVLFLNSYGVSQTNLQRICAVPTIGQARRVLLMNLVGMVAMSILQDFSGICAFATYHGCDPLARGIITSKDQILPYFVMDQMGFIVGMPGLFVAMLYGGSLSSLSSIINSWVAVVWTDLLEPLPWFRNVTRSGAAFVNKILSLLMGLLIIAMAFFAKNFGGLFQTTMTLAGVAAGPTLGLYLTGVLVPYCDRRGAFAGLVVSATFLAWITLGASIYGSKPELLPFSSETCPGFYRDHGTNESLFKPAFPAEAPKMEAGFMDHAREVQARDSATTANASLSENDNWGLMYLYGLSYTLFMTLGMVVFVAVASLVTLITDEWRDSTLIPIFKNKGDIQECGNYRGIKLMSHTLKIWERIIDGRLRAIVTISEQQFGFMPGRSTTDAIFALRQLMEKYREGQRELHSVFIDLEKAYDRVPRSEVWNCLRLKEVDEKYVRIIQDMYEGTTTKVKSIVGTTDSFQVKLGLHQGSALSPFLFALVIDCLTVAVQRTAPWDLMYADDVALNGETNEEVEERLEQWRKAMEERGMKVSRQKTEYLCMGEQEPEREVRMQGAKLNRVQEFKYLGSTVQCDGGSDKEVGKRIQAGWNAWRKITGVLCDRKVPPKLKGRLHKTMVRPAMLYGMEAVAVTKGQEAKMKVAEMRMLRIALGKTRLDKIRNTTIRETIGVGELGEKLRECRLRWLGHVTRREDEYVGKRVRRLVVRRRKRGRPKRRWEDCIKEDMETAGVTEGEALDRAEWRRKIRTGDPS